MTPHKLDRPRRLLLLGLPHPLTQVLAAWVQDVLAACDPFVESELATDQREVAPGEVPIHLRPDAAVGLGLVASLEEGSGDPAVLTARVDERWRDFPRLAAERVVSRPADAIATLASCLEVSITADMLAAADTALPALRAAVAAFGHPLAFWLALDPFTAAVAPDGSPPAATRLNCVDGEPASELLASIRPSLSAGGAVSGCERSPAAAARVAARVATGRAGWEKRVFVLAGERWATSPGGEA